MWHYENNTKVYQTEKKKVTLRWSYHGILLENTNPGRLDTSPWTTSTIIVINEPR